MADDLASAIVNAAEIMEKKEFKEVIGIKRCKVGWGVSKNGNTLSNFSTLSAAFNYANELGYTGREKDLEDLFKAGEEFSGTPTERIPPVMYLSTTKTRGL